MSILLGPAAGGELAVDFLLLPELADGASTGGARKLGDDEGGESSVGQGEGVARDNLLFLSGRTVDEHLSSSLVDEFIILLIFLQSILNANRHTRLWSIISTMVASLPVYGPERMRTTRPTSTSFHDVVLISILAAMAKTVCRSKES